MKFAHRSRSISDNSGPIEILAQNIAIFIDKCHHRKTKTGGLRSDGRWNSFDPLRSSASGWLRYCLIRLKRGSTPQFIINKCMKFIYIDQELFAAISWSSTDGGVISAAALFAPAPPYHVGMEEPDYACFSAQAWLFYLTR
jgi:hypothetical protein